MELPFWAVSEPLFSEPFEHVIILCPTPCEVFSAFFNFLQPTRLIVEPFDHLRRCIHPLGAHLEGKPLITVPGDRTGADLVW